MQKITNGLLAALFISLLSSCASKEVKKDESPKDGKVVVYQVFTRLFGNTNSTNKPWGTSAENGVGKFNDFNDTALSEIKKLGVSHIWYTGVPHHALIADYSSIGLKSDDPDVVKGRAGSPYAVKDYYNVNPDLAVDPSKRLEEFEALIQRTHNHGMKVIIDIVPNHVARKYEGKSNPAGVSDFGANDDVTVEYARDNNFCYIPNQKFLVPVSQNGYKPLGGEVNSLSDGNFDENPAKWTGNGSRKAQPDFYDWYETVKVNYGIKPDGSKDFDTIPKAYATKSYVDHYAFWQGKSVPNSWIKFRDIALYWLDKGVDGFRFDMAEMVPVEFWSYMNSSIKTKNPNAFLLAEVYNPAQFRDYIHIGKMDYLYDKVDLYDTLKHVMQGYGSTDNITPIQSRLADIEHHMLHFLENHDEQRLASPEFAGDAQMGKPAMVVSATISSSPTMIYFGQEVGEAGTLNSGFGSHSRTTIFDYAGVPNHQRWMNGGKFDGGQLTEEEKGLRDFYSRLLNFTLNSSALMGQYASIQEVNRETVSAYGKRLYSFARWSADQKLIVVANFDREETHACEMIIPSNLITNWNLKDGIYTIKDQLYGTSAKLEVAQGVGKFAIAIKPFESFIYSVE